MTFMHTKIDRELPKEVSEWIDKEAADQEELYRKIVAEMEALADTRDQWYEEFFDRLKKYGFNVDGDQRQVLKEEDLPVRPDRKHVVVY